MITQHARNFGVLSRLEPKDFKSLGLVPRPDAELFLAHSIREVKHVDWQDNSIDGTQYRHSFNFTFSQFTENRRQNGTFVNIANNLKVEQSNSEAKY
jgi:hypothetical protein